MIRFLLFMLVTALFSSCETGSLTSTPSELEGVWVFKGYRQGETLYEVPGCEKETETITLEITRKGDGFDISGRSFINTYFSRAQVNYNRSDQSGTIKFEGIGTTKMGGPENLMNCESAYYQHLGNSSKVKTESQRLYLQREPRPVDSQIWPTLVFEKKKI